MTEPAGFSTIEGTRIDRGSSLVPVFKPRAWNMSTAQTLVAKVSLPGKVIFPNLSDNLGMKITVMSHPLSSSSPSAQSRNRTTEPFRDRAAKIPSSDDPSTPVERTDRVPGEYPFAAAIAKFHDTAGGPQTLQPVIESGTRLPAYRHSCTVEF